jgi:DNA polymerase-3 subunit gamma/tau
MAYTVLARRYRSGTFDEVIGQDHVAQTLKKAIEAQRVAHAYLFTGTRGVGKTSMARILAKALNCSTFDAPTTTPCGKCSSCQAIAKGEDIDVIEIDAASNTGVDNVREIIENARFRPARSRFKIYIIDEVHMLSKAAFNALLKIMEEPPEHVKFILATTEVDKILPTILSRCQRYDFRNIPTREIVDHLKSIVRDENVKAEEESLQLVARAGAGSMRDSLSLLDRLLSVGEKTLTADMIEQLLGMPKATAIFGLANAIGNGDVKGTLESANRIIDGGLSADTLIASLIEHFHNLLVVATCGISSNLVDLVGVDQAELDAQAKAFDPTMLSTNITILEELRRQMRSSQAGRAMIDAMLARLAMSGQFATIGELVSRLNGNGSPPGTRAGPPPARPTATYATPPRSPMSAEKKTPELRVSGELEVVEASPLRESGELRAQLAQALTHPPSSPHPIHEAGSLASREDGAAPTAITAPIESPASAAESSPAPPEEGVDELPAVGKVAAEGATRSLWQAFKKADSSRATPAKKPDAKPTGTLEPPHLGDIKAHVLTQMPPRLAGMFGGARLVALDETSGVARLYFTADDAGHAHYVTRNREQYAKAFEIALRRPITLEIEAEPEPEIAKAAQEQARPRVVRPRLDDVAAEHVDEAPTPMIDIDAVKDDPLVAAIMAKFDGARIVKVE